jgi:hypothetical protein
MRSSGTLTVPKCTSPPNPVGTPRPVSVLKTVVFPEPAKPTRPTLIEDLERLTDRERVSMQHRAMSNARLPGGFLDCSATRHRASPAQPNDQIDEDGEVHDQRHHTRGRDAARDFKDLERNE